MAIHEYGRAVESEHCLKQAEAQNGPAVEWRRGKILRIEPLAIAPELGHRRGFWRESGACKPCKLACGGKIGSSSGHAVLYLFQRLHDSGDGRGGALCAGKRGRARISHRCLAIGRRDRDLRAFFAKDALAWDHRRRNPRAAGRGSRIGQRPGSGEIHHRRSSARIHAGVGNGRDSDLPAIASKNYSGAASGAAAPDAGVGGIIGATGSGVVAGVGAVAGIEAGGVGFGKVSCH